MLRCGLAGRHGHQAPGQAAEQQREGTIMKTVGVITAHCSTNPGASLQAHAICQKIADLGHKPVMIDYRPDYFTDIAEQGKTGKPSGKDRLKMMVLGRRLNGRHRLFQQFEKEYYPEKTACYRTAEQILAAPPSLDAYLCGSDQIWNPAHVRYDKTFFLEFAKHLAEKKLSYAASIGQDVVDVKGCDFLKSSIDTMDRISVREDTAKSLLQNTLGIEKTIHQHIDPTLLYPPSYWRSIEKMPNQKMPEKYILYYPLQDNPIVEELALLAKQQTGLPCVALCSSLRKPRFADVQISIYGPREFLHVIDQAHMVLTNSFHGIVMALLMGSNVVPYRNLVRNSRIESLFRTLKLENMQIDTIDAYRATDWNEVWEKAKNIAQVLETERARATKYLAEVLL
jgi:hypothetical protein